jgi:hypothetical protein
MDASADMSTVEGAADPGPELPQTPELPPAVLDTAPDTAPDIADTLPAVPDVTPDTKPDAAKPDAAKPDALPADATPALQPCQPPLAIVPADAMSLPLDLVQLQASGGTGAYQWALLQNQSEALLNPLTGAYLAGDKPGAVDVVGLSDQGCIGSAQAKIAVVQPMAVLPKGALLPPLKSFKFKVAGGSGSVTYKLVIDKSGAKVSPFGQYQAGLQPGTDIIRIEDAKTGQVVEVAVEIQPGANMAAVPAHAFLPLGSALKVAVTGGTGELEAKASGAVTFADGVVTAQKPGSTTVTLTDMFTSQVATLQVEVVAASEPQFPRTGDYMEQGVATVLDLDGDNLTDFALGVVELDTSNVNDGGVLVWQGAMGGPKAAPLQVLHGTGQESRFGMALAAGNLDKSAHDELVVGASLADAGAVDAGAVYVYERDAKAGLFASEPVRTLAGPFASDNFGSAVALCDFNGDGWLDLAVGAPGGEDRDLSPVPTDQGAIHVFLGHDVGFLDKAEQVVFGELPGKDGWKPAAGIRLGTALAAGDFDGDGVCDLAAGAVNYTQPGGPGAGDGLVVLYRGVKASKQTLGGIAGQPSRAWAPDQLGDAQSAFGRMLALGDVNGDQKADLLVGQRNHDVKKVSNAGAARLYLGKQLPLDPTTALIPAGNNDWTEEGIAASDGLGGSVAIGDANGDGVGDVLIGVLLGEELGVQPPPPADTGLVQVYLGKNGKVPEADAAHVLAGAATGARMGVAVLALPNGDGDAKADLLLWASADHSLGGGVGRLFFAKGSKGFADPVPLDLPGLASNVRYGTGLAVVGDLDGDGWPDLVAGAPLFDDPKGTRATMGAAFLFKGGKGGFAPEPAFTWFDFLGHSAGDGFGQSVADVGDFDGDGSKDFAVVARLDDSPTSWGTGYLVEPGNVSCYLSDPAKPGAYKAMSDNGAVYVWKGTKQAELKPRWVVYGTQAGQALDGVFGGFDYDGDGLDDFALTSLNADKPGRNNCGAVRLVRGRKPSKTTSDTTVLCPDAELYGTLANDAFGRAVVGLGDLDGDGCDELAIGSNGLDQGKTDQGGVWLVHGFGPKCVHANPNASVLLPGETGAQAGFALGAGDLDGDALGDLVVGGVGHAKAGTNVGGAWVVRGSYLKKLIAKDWQDGAVDPDVKSALVDPASSGLGVDGFVAGERFGSAVAIVPRPDKKGFAGIAVGSPLGDLGAGPLTGAVRVYQYTAVGNNVAALVPVPVAGLVGEAGRPNGRLGESLAVGVLDGKPWAAAGGQFATPLGCDGVDLGGVYGLGLGALKP